MSRYNSVWFSQSPTHHVTNSQSAQSQTGLQKINLWSLTLGVSSGLLLHLISTPRPVSDFSHISSQETGGNKSGVQRHKDVFPEPNPILLTQQAYTSEATFLCILYNIDSTTAVMTAVCTGKPCSLLRAESQIGEISTSKPSSWGM